MTPESCPSFESCSAPLCPLDQDLEKRIWYAGEEFCRSRKFGQHRWVRKQRSIQRRGTRSWFERPVSFGDLFAASRPRNLSEDYRKKLAERLSGSGPISCGITK
jgi:hypothetical protein